jgi:hypothetical protein
MTIKRIIPQMDKLVTMVLKLEADVRRFDNGNNAAGVRVRKGLNDIAKHCKKVRSHIQTIKKARASDKNS